jgi:arsenite methyltransferase
MTTSRRPEDADQLRELVREGYTRVVQQRGASDAERADATARRIGYSEDQLEAAPDGARVYAEAFRVLRPGGRIMISDVVLERPLPEAVLDSIDAYLGCVGGASLRGEYLETIAKAGFREVRVDREASFINAISFDDPPVREAMDRLGISEKEARGFADAVTSLHIFALK